jgi:hypothetical protein
VATSGAMGSCCEVFTSDWLRETVEMRCLQTAPIWQQTQLWLRPARCNTLSTIFSLQTVLLYRRFYSQWPGSAHYYEFFFPVILNPRSGYKRGEQFVWKENPRNFNARPAHHHRTCKSCNQCGANL